MSRDRNDQYLKLLWPKRLRSKWPDREVLFQVAKVACGLFYCWSLLRNNYMATNRQRFTSSYDSSSRHFAACVCWIQTSLQVMQRDS